MFCTYLTVYFGHNLPRLYIGSSNIKRISNGYHGSPASKQFKQLWENELTLYPQLFKTRILKTFNTREEAFIHELFLQTKYNVVKSSKFANMALAKKNGYKGRDVSGSNNPMFGKNRTGEIRKEGTGDRIRQGQQRSSKFNSEEVKLARSERAKGSKNSMFGKQHSEEWKANKSKQMTGSNHPGYGKKRTLEQRAKISETRKLRIQQGLIVPWNKQNGATK